MADGGGRRDGNGGDSEEQSIVEVAVIIVSVVLTASLFAFTGWQMVAGPATAQSEASVVETRTAADGGVIVTIKLRNRQGIGLTSATVEADCDTPPSELGFNYVLADSVRRGWFVCPPGTGTPTVTRDYLVLGTRSNAVRRPTLRIRFRLADCERAGEQANGDPNPIYRTGDPALDAARSRRSCPRRESKE